MGSKLTRLVSHFFGWWLRELAGCIPVRLRHLWRPARTVLAISDEDDALSLRLQRGQERRVLGRIPLDEIAKTRLRQLLPNLRLDRLQVLLLLPADRVLRRRVALPLAAMENLREVLGFDLDRHAPFPPEDAAFDHRVLTIDREAQQVSVELVVAARRDVERMLSHTAALGLEADRVDAAGPEGEPQGWNLLERDESRSGGRLTGRLSIGLAVGVGALVALLLWLPLERQDRVLAAYEERLAQARAAAEEVDTLRSGLDQALTGRQFLDRHRSEAPLAIAALKELTDRLPDSSWVIQLRLSRKELQVAGYSPDAAALIPVLEESPLLEDVRFTAPVTPDDRLQLERFNLAARLAAAEGVE